MTGWIREKRRGGKKQDRQAMGRWKDLLRKRREKRTN